MFSDIELSLRHTKGLFFTIPLSLFELKVRKATTKIMTKLKKKTLFSEENYSQNFQRCSVCAEFVRL